MKNNAGFGVVGVVLLVAAIGLIGFIGWRLYDASKTRQSDSESSSSQQSVNMPTSSQTEQIDPSVDYVVIKEWGMRFKLVDGFDDVEYFRPGGVTTDSISFTTKQLAQLEPGCSAGSNVLGLLTRTKDSIPGYGAVIVTVGDYKYQYRAPDVACNKNEANFLTVGKGVTNLFTSLKSLEAAN